MWDKHIFALMSFPTQVKICLALLAGGFLLSCIERDNPFDPINLSSVQPPVVRQSLQSQLDSLWQRAQAIQLGLGDLQAALSGDSLNLRRSALTVEAFTSSNTTRRLGNEALRLANLNQADFALLQNLIRLDSLPIFIASVQFTPLGRWKDELIYLRTAAQGIMDSANRSYFPIQIYDDVTRTTRISAYDKVLEKQSKVVADTARWNAVVDSNRIFLQPQNLKILSENTEIDRYNDSLDFRRIRGNHPLIVNSDSLLATVKNLKAGDTLYLGSGSFAGRLNFERSGTLAQPILVQGNPNGGTRLTSASKGGEVLIIDGKKNIVFRDLVIENSQADGAKLINGSDSITFDHCDFLNNALDGLVVADADVRITDCRFMKNKGSGIRFNSISTVTNQQGLHLVNVLIVQNGLYGIEGVELKGTIELATIADNAVDGIRLSGSRGEVSLYSSIVAYNLGYGFNFQGGTPLVNQLSLLNCDVIANARDNFSLPPLMSQVNNPVDKEPNFVNRSSSLEPDYSLTQDNEILLDRAIGWRKR